MESFDKARFERQVNEALIVAERVLTAARCGQLPAERDHGYGDKYDLAQTDISAAVVSSLQTLQTLGLTGDALRTLRSWAAGGQAVTLRFTAESKCTFVKETKREEDRPHSMTTTESIAGAVVTALTTKVTTSITEFVWSYESSWALDAYSGTGREGEGSTLALGGRTSGRQEIKTAAKHSPQPSSNSRGGPFQVSLTWLLQQLGASGNAEFKIDRSNAKCWTPSRNKDTAAALQFFASLRDWTHSITAIMHDLIRVTSDAQPEARVEASGMHAAGVLVPCVLFEKEPEEGQAPPAPLPAAPRLALVALAPPAAGTSALVNRASINALLAEAYTALSARIAAQSAPLPAPASSALVTGSEAALLVSTDYLRRVIQHCEDGLGYVENMLREGLVAALGKVVSPADFAAYMRFHNRKLFRPAFEPKPFCFAVRRSAEHGPEGILRIDEAAAGDTPPEPIITIAHSSNGSPTSDMSFALSAEARVSFGGERFLHAWLTHRFSGSGPATLNLVASARQFSSFIVLVGRIGSATSFEPTVAAIVKDKDEISIPLAISSLPTPKEFKDAIASLSPEQQAFAKAFRGMQLESTLFGVLVIQIKPQMETMLGLVEGSLVKEIELTQDLMDLFIKFQIPSDLLSYSGPADADKTARLAVVKGHVAAMKTMLAKAEDADIARRTKEEAYLNPRALPTSDHGQTRFYSESAEAPANYSKQGRMMKGGGGRGVTESYSMPMAMMAMPEAAMMMDSAPAPMMARRMMAAPPPVAYARASAPAPAVMDMSAPSPAPSPAPAAPDASAGTTFGTPAEEEEAPAVGRDVTKVPGELDRAYEQLDSDSALRPAIITPSSPWTKRSTASLLSKTPITSSLGTEEQKTARAAAFDLLDALTRSGALPVSHAQLHVVLGATHCFDESLVETLVQRNVNPIERVERSTLIMAGAIHALPVADLVRRDHVPRLAAVTPLLFADAPAQGALGGH